MGKERKPSTGHNNLSRKTLTENVTQDDSNVNSSDVDQEGKKFYHFWTGKLLVSQVAEAPPKKKKEARKMKLLATWRQDNVTENEYESVATSSYRPPDMSKVKELKTFTTEEIQRENKEKTKQKEVIEKLCKITKERYGTTASMFKSFRKNNDEKISIYELSEYLRRHKLSDSLTDDDKETLFNAVDPKHHGEVYVKDLLKKAEEQEFIDDEHKKDMLKIRNFLADHVQLVRSASQDSNDNKNTEFEKKKKSKGISQEDELMKLAVGHRPFDLDLSMEEYDQVIEEAFFKNQTNISHNKYARFLRHGNVKLKEIPFYENRSKYLDNLKHRAAMVDENIENSNLLSRLKELEMTRWQHSLSTIQNPDDFLKTSESSPQLQWTSSPLSTERVVDQSKESFQFDQAIGMITSKSAPALLPKVSMSSSPSPLGIMARPSPLQLLSKEKSSKSGIDSITTREEDISPKKSFQNLFKNSGRGDENFADSSREKYLKKAASTGRLSQPSHSIDDFSESNSPQNISLKPIESKEGYLFDHSENPYSHAFTRSSSQSTGIHVNDATDFYASIVDSSQSMGRMKDPSKVIRVEKMDPKVGLFVGKKIQKADPTDWNRIGVGGERVQGEGYGDSMDDRFLTTTNQFYPPLIYEPSKPVRRNILSEADSDFKKKEFRRQERRARLEANLQVTKTRTEHEELQREIRSMRRVQSRINDHIRYQSAIFLNDLKAFKQQPLERMAKKSNLTASDRMWGGNLRDPELLIAQETRDFTTTYRSSLPMDTKKVDVETLNTD